MHPTPERRPPRTTWWSWLLVLAVFVVLTFCIVGVVSTITPWVMP